MGGLQSGNLSVDALSTNDITEEGGGEPTQEGVDYFYDGSKISEGKKNGLDNNRIVRTRNGKTTNETFDLKNTSITFSKQEFDNQPDGAYLNLFGRDGGNFAFSVYKWLFLNAEKQVNGRIAEWSIVQYETVDYEGVTFSRIATSFNSDMEYTNTSLSMVRELNEKNITNITKWLHYHTHYKGNSLPSDLDRSTYNKIENTFKMYNSTVVPQFYISPFDDP